MGRILDRYEALLLDMNSTFMFGEDRFGPGHDYHATYRAISGTRLTPDQVRRAVDDCHDRLTARYEDPGSINCFPQVREVLAQSLASLGLPAAEAEFLEHVIARHELGHVPDDYAAALRRLATRHRLGVVTNVWSRKQPWLDELCRAGVLDLFEVVVVSSDGPYMKPSPVLFGQALAALAVPAAAAAVVGDSLRCDIGGAAAAGMDSVWVNPGTAPRPPGSPAPTFEVPSLLALVHDEPGTIRGGGSPDCP